MGFCCIFCCVFINQPNQLQIVFLALHQAQAIFYVALTIPYALKKELNVDSLFGESGFTVNERKWLRPTLDCNGIVGGYIEEGAKTIIPSKASAKLSMRLVANQDPDDILNKFKAYIYSLQPEGISLDIKAHTHAYPAKMDVNSKAMKAAEKAFEAVYQVPPFYVGEGVTIPVVADFKRILNLDTVMMGFNLPDDGIHSPNERFALRNFKKGIEASLHFLHYLGASGC